ncbi:hypothetical protein D9Q98_008590 [Chlorella vulgaris]|uniref:Uncharacterized protein n=1 Tax=Chlorella vulgaris TaxID=3077 RepID=A0A9D4TI76_CHLVU|nr:hypothetical protein D9Q98_008590 [Chlorella vulgaris]
MRALRAELTRASRLAVLHLPLAKDPASLEQLDIANWQGYIQGSLLPHIAGPAVALIVALAFLLTFIAWRLVKCCTCCACVRGPQRKGHKAHKLLTSRKAVWLKASAAAAAAGILAGGVYGVTQVQADMVDSGLAAIDAVTAFIDHALTAGSATVAASQALDSQLMAVRDGLVALGPGAAGLAIDDAHASLAGFLSFDSDLSTIRTSTVDRVESAIEDYSPTAHMADKWRAVGLYIAYGVLAGLAVMASFAMLVDWPAPTKPLVLIFLLLLLLAWIIVLALTAVLRVGNDVCMNVEDKVQELVSGISLGGSSGGGGVAALVQYYLFGTGGTVFSVLNSAVGLDVPGQLVQANATLLELQEAVDSTPALSSLSSDVALVTALFANVSASVDALGLALSYETFHPVWTGVKAYVCCELLNSVGCTWTALIVTASFGLTLILLAFIWIGRMDKLQAFGCCHFYSARDYSLEGECADAGCRAGPAVLPEKAGPKSSGTFLESISCPQSPIMARREAPVQPPSSPKTAAATASAPQAGRVGPAPLFHSLATGVPVPGPARMYPPVPEVQSVPSKPNAAYRPPSPQPPPAVAITSSSFPFNSGGSFVASESELQVEAHRAAELAGRALSMVCPVYGLC